MNLVVHIPHDGADEAAAAFSLAQRAPSFTMEWTGSGRMSIAIFPSLPTGLDLAVQLVGEAIQIPGPGQASMPGPYRPSPSSGSN